MADYSMASLGNDSMAGIGDVVKAPQSATTAEESDQSNNILDGLK